MAASSIAAIAVSIALGCASAPPPDELAACPESPNAERVAGLEPLLVVGDASRGADLFEVECAKCHSPRIADRSSRLFRGYPRLDCELYLAAAPAAYLAGVISKGGTAFGLDDAMKPFASRLSEDEIADLVAYLRGVE